MEVEGRLRGKVIDLNSVEYDVSNVLVTPHPTKFVKGEGKNSGTSGIKWILCEDFINVVGRFIKRVLQMHHLLFSLNVVLQFIHRPPLVSGEGNCIYGSFYCFGI